MNNNKTIMKRRLSNEFNLNRPNMAYQNMGPFLNGNGRSMIILEKLFNENNLIANTKKSSDKTRLPTYRKSLSTKLPFKMTPSFSSLSSLSLISLNKRRSTLIFLITILTITKLFTCPLIQVCFAINAHP